MNLLLVVVLLIASAALIARWNQTPLSGEGRWLGLAMLFFGIALVWRDGPTLTTANALALVVAVTLAALTSRAGQLRLAGLSQYAIGVSYVLGYAVAGLVPVLRHEVRPSRPGGPMLAAGRGLALATIPLFVFGALFAAADANFEHLLSDTFQGLENVPTRLACIAIYAWLIGGTLREMLLAPERPRSWSEPPARLALGAIETGVLLGLIDLLFLTFVILQLPYLFGAQVQVATMGYSEYARRGFFELVWVAGLTLPLLLVVHWAVRSPWARRVYGVLALGLVALLFVVMTSAVQRMQIYVGQYGLTELRVQSSAFMGWLAVVLVWFVATVLRGQRARFAFGALVSAFVVIGALDVVNPDALIVRTNASVGHLMDGDRRALASLSADAAPALVEALPTLSEEERAKLVSQLQRKWGARPGDWRTFNLSRAQAIEAVAGAS